MADVLIYARAIKLEVVLPKHAVYEFMDEFGHAFGSKTPGGAFNIKAVDGYYNHPNGWHVHVTIDQSSEHQFYTFLKEFCDARKMAFREPSRSE